LNNTWVIEIESPILRPGITVSTEVSERYVVEAVIRAVQIAREINSK